ncbi:MAG: flagellar protein FlaG [Planctomycetota bacterium]
MDWYIVQYREGTETGLGGPESAMGSVEFGPVDASLPANVAFPIPRTGPPPEPLELRAPKREADAAPEQMDRESLEIEVQKLNEVMENLGNDLRFGLFDGTGQLFVQLIDTRRNEVIKMMPPEHYLRLQVKIQQAVGIVLDETV